jgi:hypothetical protein
MSEHSETALTTRENGFLQLADRDMAKIMAEEFDGLKITFNRIRIPIGSTVFEVPGEDGEIETIKEFSGVILHHHPLRSYYIADYTGESHPPECGSYDGVIGQGNPGGKCESCKYDQFGTGKNGGKACKTRRRLYIQCEGEIFPILFNVPPQSVNLFTNYLMRLITKGGRSNTVITKFSLRKATGGRAYSQVHFVKDRLLSPDEQSLIARLSDQIEAHSRQVPIEDDEMVDVGEATPFIDPETGEIIR